MPLCLKWHAGYTLRGTTIFARCYITWRECFGSAQIQTMLVNKKTSKHRSAVSARAGLPHAWRTDAAPVQDGRRQHTCVACVALVIFVVRLIIGLEQLTVLRVARIVEISVIDVAKVELGPVSRNP